MIAVLNARTTTLPTLLLIAALAGCDGTSARGPSKPVARESIDAALTSAERLLAAQRFEDAETVAATLAERAPESWRAQELLGRVLGARAAILAESSNDPADDARVAALRRRASAAYWTAAQRARDNAGLWSAAGLAAQWDGHADAALEAFRTAGSLAPDDIRHPTFEAQIHLQRGHLDEAGRCIERALAIRPDDAIALASRAEIARQRGELDAALVDVRAARRQDPGNVALRVSEARILRQSNRPRDGLELLLALGAERWRERDAIEEVALGFAAIGEPRRAAEAWESARRARPRDWVLAFRAAESWFAADDPVRADGWLREAEMAAGDDQRVVDLRRRLRAP